MKRLLALLPALAVPAALAVQENGPAFEGWSYEPLQDDVRATELVGMDVAAASGSPIGTVRDVLVGSDGRFKAVSIEFDHEGGSGFALASMAWSDIVIVPQDAQVRVSVGIAPDAPGERIATVEEGVTVRNFIGAPVSLADAEDFAEVTDILIEPGQPAPTALLVESGPGKVYALPVPGGLDAESASVRYDATSEQVQGLGEFEARGD